MKHLAALIALPLAALAVPAYAVEESPASNNDSATVNVTGNVANLCILGDPSLPNVDVGQMVNTSGAQVGKIATIGNQVVNLPNSFCNFAGTQVGVTTSALLGPAGTPPASFSRAVNYTATASGWAAANAAATSGAAFDGSTPSASGSGGTQNGPKLNTIVVTLSSFTVPENRLLVAGRERPGFGRRHWEERLRSAGGRPGLQGVGAAFHQITRAVQRPGVAQFGLGVRGGGLGGLAAAARRRHGESENHTRSQQLLHPSVLSFGFIRGLSRFGVAPVRLGRCPTGTT